MSNLSKVWSSFFDYDAATALKCIQDNCTLSDESTLRYLYDRTKERKGKFFKNVAERIWARYGMSKNIAVCVYVDAVDDVYKSQNITITVGVSTSLNKKRFVYDMDSMSEYESKSCGMRLTYRSGGCVLVSTTEFTGSSSVRDQIEDFDKFMRDTTKIIDNNSVRIYDYIAKESMLSDALVGLSSAAWSHEILDVMRTEYADKELWMESVPEDESYFTTDSGAVNVTGDDFICFKDRADCVAKVGTLMTAAQDRTTAVMGRDIRSNVRTWGHGYQFYNSIMEKAGLIKR